MVFRAKVIGAVMLVVAIIVTILYVWLMFCPPDIEVFGMSVDYFLLKLTAVVAVAVIMGLIGWIGYTLVTVPEPKTVEEIEKLIEEREKEKSKTNE